MGDSQIKVEVLGATILSKATTSGLGSIQKPLYEKYVQYRKSGKGKKSQTAFLKVSSDGITVIFPTEQPNHTQNYFYEKNSVNFFEAVRFTTSSKGGDKKYQCAFLPIDESRTLNQGYEKLFSPLEKKHINLAKMEHPAIIACILRRPVGVRSLDCHGFVTENDSDAYRIMNAFFTASVEYRRLGPEVTEEYGPRYQFRPPSEGHKPDLIQTEYGPYGIYQGGKPVNLTDDHFRGKTRDSDRRNYNDEPEVVDRYIGNIGKDERQPNSRYSFENRNDRRDISEGYAGSQPMYTKINRQSAELQQERQRLGEFGANDRRGIEQNMHFRQRSDELAGSERRVEQNIHYRQRSGEIDPGRYVEERGRLPARDEGPIRIPRPMSPLRNQGPVVAPKPSRALSPEPRFPRNEARSPDSPKSPRQGLRNSGREPPLSPREFPQSGPVSSVSNIESRQEQKGSKPVAKVPPHLVSGIKVLPTGFVPKLESPKSPRRDVIGNVENYYTNEEDPYDNAMSKKDYYNARRNIHSEGYDGKEDRYYREAENRPFGNNPPPDILPAEEKRWNDDRWRYGPETESPRYQNEQKANRNSAPSGNYGKPWSYGEQLEKFKEKELVRSSSNHEFEPQESGGKMLVDKNGAKIEHDYANMFSKVNVRDESNSQLHTAGTNFESSLGYFP